MLLLPSAVLAIYAAVRRKSVFGLTLSFSMATVIASIAESAYTVYVMKKFDSKFRFAPDAAFELSLFGDAVVAFIGLLLFGATFTCYVRQAMHRTGIIGLTALSGGIYATLPKALYWCDIAAPPLLWWIWTLLIPVASALLISRQVRQGHRNRLAACGDAARLP
jgi:hypothetical protein